MSAARKIEPTPIGVNEEMLYRAMIGLFLVGGFSEVVNACQRQQKRLAREFRGETGAQGWIV